MSLSLKYTGLQELGPSDSVFKGNGIDIDRARLDPNYALFFYDDWRDFPLIGTQTTQIAHGKYKVFHTTAGTCVPVSTVNSVELQRSVLSFNPDTDNDSGSIAQAYPSYLLSGDPATSGKLAFECRVAVNNVATNGIGWMIGLGEVDQWTLATGVPMNGGDAITNAASFVGFRSKEDLVSSAKTIDSVYSDRATSFTDIQATIGSMTAYTFVKLGFVYDPNDTTNCLKFYVDGVLQSTVVSRSTLTGLTNLDANALGLIAACVADSAGTSSVFYIDWWTVCQLRPGQN